MGTHNQRRTDLQVEEMTERGERTIGVTTTEEVMTGVMIEEMTGEWTEEEMTEGGTTEGMTEEAMTEEMIEEAMKEEMIEGDMTEGTTEKDLRKRMRMARIIIERRPRSLQ